MLKFKNFDNIYSPRLGLIRTLLAVGNLLTLLLNSAVDMFPKIIWDSKRENAMVFLEKANFFFIGSNYNSVEYLRWLGIIILILVIVGYAPQITCLLHMWIAYSIFYGLAITEGGDQITAILTLMLVPICIFDRRINHWHSKMFFNFELSSYLKYFVYCSFCLLQFQVVFVYLHSAIGKAVKPYWFNGSILYYWINDPMFGANSNLLKIFNFLFESGTLTFLMTWSVIVLEFLIAASIIMNKKQRLIILKLGICFHVLIFFVHGLASFGLAMIACLLILIAPYKRKKKHQVDLSNYSKQLANDTL